MKPIYILGCGAIGYPLAVFLQQAGRRVVAVRTSQKQTCSPVEVTVKNGATTFREAIKTVALEQVERMDGLIVIAAKSYANPAIAARLSRIGATGPVLLLQNGLGVERPFQEAGFSTLYRCVLYATSQSSAQNQFSFQAIAASPVGAIQGTPSELEACVELLTTSMFPFRSEPDIQREIWQKVIANVVFNSLCPLLETDNGIFDRDSQVAEMAQELIRECVPVLEQLGIGLKESELMAKVLLISRGSSQFISTLQDIRSGRPTEIESLNLEVARLAAALNPPVRVPTVEMLGKLILAKSQLTRSRTN